MTLDRSLFWKLWLLACLLFAWTAAGRLYPLMINAARSLNLNRAMRRLIRSAQRLDLISISLMKLLFMERTRDVDC